jgi:hypothetical protein
MSTLAKVAVGVAMAKGASAMMNKSGGRSVSQSADGGLGGLLGGLAGGSGVSAGQAGGLQDMLGGLLGGGGGTGQSGGMPGGLGGLLEQIGGGSGGGQGGLQESWVDWLAPERLVDYLAGLPAHWVAVPPPHKLPHKTIPALVRCSTRPSIRPPKPKSNRQPIRRQRLV